MAVGLLLLQGFVAPASKGQSCRLVTSALLTLCPEAAAPFSRRALSVWGQEGRPRGWHLGHVASLFKFILFFCSACVTPPKYECELAMARGFHLQLLRLGNAQSMALWV